MKTILVFGDKTFKIQVPDGAVMTFGPWAPPGKSAERSYNDAKALNGTLRVYQGSAKPENIIGVFSGVSGFRDMALGYDELVAREEGAAIWKSDENGYSREEKAKSTKAWVKDPIALAPGELVDADEEVKA